MVHRRGRWATVLLAATLAAGTATAVSQADTQPSSGQFSQSQLTGRAVLPASTFRVGSAPSGAYFSASDRASAAANGVAVAAAPAPAFAHQPVQGFSALIPAAGGDWWALTDNGFGSRANSVDAELWVNKVKLAFGAGSAASVVGGFGLSDPEGFIPWKIICDATAGKALPDFDFNTFPTTTPELCGPAVKRKLTGFDFDLESVQIAADGTFWFGEEFGPFLLHTNQRGELLSAPVPLPGVTSPQNPTLDLAKGEQPTINSSKGFEGLAISPDRSNLYAMTEGAVASDDQRDLRINVFDIPSGKFTGQYWKVRLELRSTKVNLTTLKHADGSPVYPGTTAPPAGLNAIGELTMINNHQAVLIERDNGGDAPSVPHFKKLFLLDFDSRYPYAAKTMVADLMAIPDPDNIAGDPAPNGYFSFPFVTIESVFPMNDHTLLLVNDNNFPFSNGRSFSKGGPLAADDNEFITLGFDRRFDLDPAVMNVPASPADQAAGANGDRNPYTVALVGDQNYGCDLTVEPLTNFKQGTTVPKCNGPLADDLPPPAGNQVPGRQKSTNMILSVNAAQVAFSIHDGDTKSGSTECRASTADATKAQFNGLPYNGTPNPGFDAPIVYTPGDNEWTDCHRYAATKNVPFADQFVLPLTNLAMLRAKFFSAPLSQGRTTMPVTPQSAEYPENVRWERGPIMYVTINQPGSNNNFCSPNQNTTVCDQGGEAYKRNAANMTWLRDSFDVARHHNDKAIIVTAQGNPNFERNPANDLPTYDMNGYVDFLNTMRFQTANFDGQVVYVHGDSHSITFDHPLNDENGAPLANFTRIETAGKEDSHWVKMTVNPRGKTLLSFEAVVVPANLGNNPNGLPWNVTQLPQRMDLPRIS